MDYHNEKSSNLAKNFNKVERKCLSQQLVSVSLKTLHSKIGTKSN